MEFQDKTLECIDCQQPFTFTAGEQEFYDRKGFKEVPKRCKSCREIRKQRRGGPGAGPVTSSGNDYGNGGGGNSRYYGGQAAGGNSRDYGNDYGNGGGYSAGGGNYGNGGNYNDRGGGNYNDRGGGGNYNDRGGGGNYGSSGGARPQREMFDATCAACGAPARVPFRPAANRPVYCRDCYANRSTGG